MTAREFYDLDPGETRTIIKGTGGRLELLTASEKSSEGDPATAIMLNESHHMTHDVGWHSGRGCGSTQHRQVARDTSRPG